MRKASLEISQVPLLYRAICGNSIMRDRLFGVSSCDYTQIGDWFWALGKGQVLQAPRIMSVRSEKTLLKHQLQ